MAPCLQSVQASHLVTPSWEAYQRRMARMAAYSAVPEARTTNRPAAARRTAVAGGDGAATALGVEEGDGCSDHATRAVLLRASVL
jgi:hypothetical protein